MLAFLNFRFCKQEITGESDEATTLGGNKVEKEEQKMEKDPCDTNFVETSSGYLDFLLMFLLIFGILAVFALSLFIYNRKFGKNDKNKNKDTNKNNIRL